METFEQLLSGGHPNSLGKTEDVVTIVLRDPKRIQDLYDTYQSSDAVVRLRVSSAFKRIAQQKPELMDPYIDRFIDEVSAIDQPSAQWSFAQIMHWLDGRLNEQQRQRSITQLQRILKNTNDWIALNMTMETLTFHAKNDSKLRDWLHPRLEKLTKDPRKSVAKRARNNLEEIKQ